MYKIIFYANKCSNIIIVDDKALVDYKLASTYDRKLFLSLLVQELITMVLVEVYSLRVPSS